MYLRHIGLDFLWFLNADNKWTAKPNWFKLFGPNIYYQDASSWTDPLPFIIGTWNNIKKILIGSGVSIIITIIGLIIFASLLTYTSIAESTIPTVTIVITIISILIGSSICMSTVRKNGIINGVLIGLIYIGFIYILSSVIEGNFALDLKSAIA